MTIRIDIADSGQFIELKDVEDMTHGDLKAISGAVKVTVNTEDETVSYPGNSDDLTLDALASRVITNWNLPHPLPKGDHSKLDCLTPKQYKVLKDGLAAHIKAVNEARAAEKIEEGTDPTEG